MWREDETPSFNILKSGASPSMLAVISSLQRQNPTYYISSKNSILLKSKGIFSNPKHLSIANKKNKNTLISKMASSRLRSSCSFPNLLISCLNLTLFVLSLTSLAPVVLLKMPPTSLGFAFLILSCISILSSFMGFYSQLTHFCFITHVSLLLASLIGQVLGILALFTKEKSSLSMFKSTRDPKEAKLLVRLECGVLMAMLTMQLVVLVLSCAIHNCWVREYEGLEAEKEATAKKRSRRIARVQEESMANASKIAEIKAKEIDEKMKSKYGQWVKTDFEG